MINLEHLERREQNKKITVGRFIRPILYLMDVVVKLFHKILHQIQPSIFYNLLGWIKM